MEEKINVEEEVLESNAVPEELQGFLEKDNEVIEKLDSIIVGLDSDIELLNSQKEESEKDFEDRLNDFKEQLTKEKEEVFEEFARKEQMINEKKVEIESIKLEQQGKQVNYIDSLKEITSKCYDKISSIEEAIKTCENNESLSMALDEEMNKMDQLLTEESNKRSAELDAVLEDIGEKPEETPEEANEETQSFELPDYEENFNENNIDFENSLNEEPYVTPINDYDFDEDYDNEVVSHENRKDVISVIYESEDVMEGHVFPFLNSLM